jgi:hypothetical protein
VTSVVDLSITITVGIQQNGTVVYVSGHYK